LACLVVFFQGVSILILLSLDYLIHTWPFFYNVILLGTMIGSLYSGRRLLDSGLIDSFAY
jgi:hypothetical protein